MTGKFTENDPERCAHYARFFKDLTLIQAEMIFWILFMIVLILMSISSIFHHKSAALTVQAAKFSDEETSNPSHPFSALCIRRTRVRYLAIVSLILLLAITCIVLECFAAFNIEYCDGEDLMQLYWGFWSILQIGSTIAIIGVMLQFWIVLGDVETPSWAVALGTPVLVFAAAGFIVKFLWGKVWGKFRRNKQSDDASDSSSGQDEDVEKTAVGPWVSQAPTISNANEDDGCDSNPNPNITSRDHDFRESGPVHATSFWSRDLHYLINSIITEPASSRPHAERHQTMERHQTVLSGEGREREQREQRQGAMRSHSVPL